MPRGARLGGGRKEVGRPRGNENKRRNRLGRLDFGVLNFLSISFSFKFKILI